MQKLGKISVLGGDARSAALATRLGEFGAQVFVWGREEIPLMTHSAESVAQALDGTDAVILPIPSFVEERYVYGSHTPLTAQELFSLVGDRCPIYGARLSPSIRSLAASCGVKLSDYMSLEEVQLRNAIPTAEGAIYLAMQALDTMLDGSRVAVLGYGRIGRALSERLAALGAQVTVAVRKNADMVRVAMDHHTPLHMVYSGEESSLCELCNEYDVIFNTVPHRLLSKSLLTAMPKETLLMELASVPGGWNPDDAVAVGTRVIYAPGLPGKYAPRSAGRLLAECLLPYLKGEVNAP